ncbi:cysteine proteinase [Trametes cingulata]|nr:cysteine proteinase [Trametes cingulata]
MLQHPHFRYYAYAVLSDPVFQQVAPLVILILVPTLVLLLNSYRYSIAASASMVFDSLALIFPWNWTDGSSSSSGSDRKKLKRKHVRTRDDHVARTTSQDSTYESTSEDGYYPGLVNISGTYCFMNSTLQAMASLTYLQPQLDEIHARAEALDVPTPVIDSLRELVRTLNTPSSSSRAFRPVDIINALSNHNPGKHNSLFSSREHQDAQELFQLLSECIKSEASAVAKESRRDRGLGGLTKQDALNARDLSQTVFDGLTANRRSCMECGYTEAVMHFPFDNWQLAVPRMVGACCLEECLEDYTRLELLNDCICRKCSMLATYRRLEQEAERLTEASQASQDPTSSKKKRARDARKLMMRVKAALDEGRIEEDIKGVKMEKIFSRASTKQSMIARPPPVLALHLNRSMHYGHYAAKNNCRVVFPEILDLTPYTTSGQLSTQPSAPISSPPPPIPIQRSVTPTPSTYAVPRTLYRLAAVVCHYGQHSFGHYVCFRRKPRPPSAGDRRFAPPKLACPLGCDCARCERYGPVRDDDDSGSRPGRGWLRISDDTVQECGIERVLQEGSGAFMLYYERVQQPRASPYTASPRGSEETVKGEELRAQTAGVVVATNGAEPSKRESRPNGDASRRRESRERREDKDKVVGPRIVRRTSAHRKTSAPPMSRSESSSSTASSKQPNGDANLSNGRSHHHHHNHHHHHSHRPQTPPNGSADPPVSPQRPPLSPTPSSKSGRLRKSRRSISQSDTHPLSPTQAAPPASLRA